MDQETAETEDSVRKKLRDGEYVAGARSGTSSAVWKVFHPVQNDLDKSMVGYVVCSKCPDYKYILKCKEGTGTSTMMRHIQSKHAEVTPRKACTPQAKTLMLDACVYYIGRDKAPFYSLEKKGMRRLLQTAIDIGATYGNVDVDALMAHRTTVANHVDQEAEKIRQKLVPDLLQALGAGSGGTVDLWTCKQTSIHMLSFTLTYVNTLFRLETHNLLMVQFLGAETKERVQEAVVFHLQKYYGIPPEEGRKIVMVTDGGKNVALAMQAFADTWLYCLDHVLNVCVRGSLDLKYHDLIGAACLDTPLCSAFMGAVQEAVALVKDDPRRRGPVAALKSVLCPAKPWNSFTTMLLSVRAYLPRVKQHCADLGRGDLLSAVTEDALDECVSFLSVLDYDGGGREKAPEVTSAKVPALLEHCEVVDGDSEMLIQMKKRLQEELQIMPLVEQVTKCKDLVAYFKRSGLMPNLSKSLEQEIEVRWNSHLTLLKSLDEMWDEVTNVLRDANKLERMAGVSRDAVRLLIKFYTPFKEESLKLEGEKYPTLPLALPAIVRLKKHCAQELRPTPSDVDVDEPQAQAEDLAFTLLRKKVQRHLECKVTVGLTYKIGAFFHPRFRLLQPLTIAEREETYAAVRNMIGEGEGGEAAGQDQLGAPPPAKRSRLDDGYDWESWEDGAPAAPVAEGEVTRYLREATSKVTTDTLLDWWKTEGSAYPKLQKLSKKYLAIPATSSNSERSFSGTGYILDDKGTRTAPETLGSIMLLNGYYRTKEDQV